MKILYDHQIFEQQEYGGISRYFYELIKGFSKLLIDDTELALQYTNNYYLTNDPFYRAQFRRLKKYEEFLSNYRFKGKGKINYILRKIGLINYGFEKNLNFSKQKLRISNFDVFHPTYYNDYFLKYINKKPFILTIFDMTYEIFPNYFKDYEFITRMKKNLALKATKIVAISNNTKADIVKYFDIDEKKIEVIYLGNSFENLTENNDQINDFLIYLPKKYILFVGNRSHYKNFTLFIEAIYKILNKDRDLYLVCAGGGAFTDEEIILFSNLGIKNQPLHYSADDKTLFNLYKNALAFIFPSLYEGFGIPILEAFYCGCPVILSNSSSLPEIAGDAAIYFDPQDRDSILESVSKVLFNDSLREILRHKGFERLKNFSWGKTILETKEIYNSIL